MVVFHTIQENKINYYSDKFKDEDISLRSGLNATEVTSYQYLGMTKIAGALNFPVFHTIQENKINDYFDKFLQLDLVCLSHNLPDLCQLDSL
jgi:hypothetical protein